MWNKAVLLLGLAASLADCGAEKPNEFPKIQRPVAPVVVGNDERRRLSAQ